MPYYRRKQFVEAMQFTGNEPYPPGVRKADGYHYFDGRTIFVGDWVVNGRRMTDAEFQLEFEGPADHDMDCYQQQRREHMRRVGTNGS